MPRTRRTTLAILLVANAYALYALLARTTHGAGEPTGSVASATTPALRVPSAEPEDTVVAELRPAASEGGASSASAARPGALADLVVLISVDGLRPDVIFPNAINIHRLQLEGTYAVAAHTASRSSTLPSHASMVSGVDVERHGLDFNAYRPERGPIHYPTIFSAAQSAGLTTALFVGKRKLEHLLQPHSQSRFEVGGIRCSRVDELALPYLANVRSGLVFLHFSDPDNEGHAHGWLSPEYLTGVERADRCVGHVVAALQRRGNLDRTLLMVTADHGGHDHDHTGKLPPDVQIPWLTWGGAARHGQRVRRPFATVDTAATILHALGLPMPKDIEGKPVLEALAEPP